MSSFSALPLKLSIRSLITLTLPVSSKSSGSTSSPKNQPHISSSTSSFCSNASHQWLLIFVNTFKKMLFQPFNSCAPINQSLSIKPLNGFLSSPTITCTFTVWEPQQNGERSHYIRKKENNKLKGSETKTVHYKCHLKETTLRWWLTRNCMYGDWVLAFGLDFWARSLKENPLTFLKVERV